MLASEPIVELEPVPELVSIELLLSEEEAPEPIDVESVVADEDDDVFAIAGSAKAATTSDVQINFFIKPPVF